MGPTYLKGLELDRIDNNGNYEPGNLRWSHKVVNINNSRKADGSNRIHFMEFRKKYPHIKPLCKYLILAGDIGSIDDKQLFPFLDYCSKNWEKIFYILGNFF